VSPIWIEGHVRRWQDTAIAFASNSANSPCIWLAKIRYSVGDADLIREPQMNVLVRSAFGLWALLSLAVASAGAQEIEGVAVVRSANEIGVADTTVRLYGSLAPNPGDSCDTAERSFQCGIIAWGELIRLADGHRLSCDIEAQRSADGVPYATCYVGERDINEALVRSGWAEAAQGVERYRVDQEDARRARRGLWAGRIRPPDRRQAP